MLPLGPPHDGAGVPRLLPAPRPLLRRRHVGLHGVPAPGPGPEPCVRRRRRERGQETGEQGPGAASAREHCSTPATRSQSQCRWRTPQAPRARGHTRMVLPSVLGDASSLEEASKSRSKRCPGATGPAWPPAHPLIRVSKQIRLPVSQLASPQKGHVHGNFLPQEDGPAGARPVGGREGGRPGGHGAVSREQTVRPPVPAPSWTQPVRQQPPRSGLPARGVGKGEGERETGKAAWH